MKNKIAIIRTTIDKPETARLIAETLVFEKFVACSQIGAPITSIYKWKGVTKCESEIPVSLKTSPENLATTIERLKQIHPYECPQILATFAEASAEYAFWCRESTQ